METFKRSEMEPARRPGFVRRDHYRGGFTHVELLVVIGIIALLISILLPALSAARASSDRVKCLSNIRQITFALISYATERRGVLPFANADGGSRGETRSGWLYTGNKLSNPAQLKDVESGDLSPYLNSRGVMHCPTDQSPYPDLGSFPQSIHPLTSYTLNVCIADYRKNYQSCKITQIRSDAILFWEPIDLGVGGGSYSWDDGTTAADQSSITKHHGTRSTVGCVDGHADLITREDFELYSGSNTRGKPLPPAPNKIWWCPFDKTGGRVQWHGN